MVPSSFKVVFTFLILFFVDLKWSDEAKILGLFPLPGRSHRIAISTLVNELASRGHEVTVYSPFPEEGSIPKYKHVALKKYTTEEILNIIFGLTGYKRIEPFEIVNRYYIEKILMLWVVGEIMCNTVLPEEPFRKLLNSNEQFDLIILEKFYIDCFLGFAHKFKTPVVQFSSFGGSEFIGDLVGNPNSYVYVPDPFQEFSDKMNFMKRLMNTGGFLLQKVIRKIFIIRQNTAMKKFFNDTNMPSIEELEKSTALVLVNHHFSISYPRPLVPNFIQVGGMHVKPPSKLPADLQKYLDDARDGAIYFSLGSNLVSSDLPEEKVKVLVAAFSKLKQKVLWKWEKDSLPGQPENLKIAKWLPQSDILAHPNVRLFITHGGLLSTQETIIRGIPIVGIPLFGDQRFNMARSESLGLGISLEFNNITEESFIWSIKQILDNPKYKENAQHLSRLFHDQPQQPLEKAVYWTEYVIRHKGAPHMRSAALDLTWYQYFLVDVIAVLGLFMCSILFVVFFLFRAIFRICWGGSKSKNRVSTKKKKN